MALIFVIAFVALLVGMAIWDRRVRRKGHTLRGAGDMHQVERDVHRNVRAAVQTMHNPVDRDWDKPDERRTKH